MNCQLCQKAADAYHEGKLPGDMKTQVEAHLEVCEKCRKSFKLQILADRVISHEKELISNPFLSTRIMARIETLETPDYITVPLYRRVLRPALMTVSLVAAILFGILIGRIYKPNTTGSQIPVELALIDDAAIESVDLLSIE